MKTNTIFILIITFSPTLNQSRAMIRSIIPIVRQNTIQGVRHITNTPLQQISSHNYYFLTGLTLTTGALYSIPYLLNTETRNVFSGPLNPSINNTPAQLILTAEEKEKRELASLHANDKYSFHNFMKAVIESEKNPHDFKTIAGESPLLIACQFKDTLLFKLLIEHNGHSLINDEFFVDGKKHTIVSYAVDKDLECIVEALLCNPHVDIDFEKTDTLIKPQQDYCASHAYRKYTTYHAAQQTKKDNDKKKILMQKLGIQNPQNSSIKKQIES